MYANPPCEGPIANNTHIIPKKEKYCGQQLRSQLNQIRKWIVRNQSNQIEDLYNNPLRERISERSSVPKPGVKTDRDISRH